MKTDHTLHIIMRVFPGLSKPNPLGLSEKLDLFSTCLESLAVAVGTVKIRLVVLLDSCPAEYESAVRFFFPAVELVFHHFKALGNVSSFRKQLEIASSLDDEALVLLLEDDYFWAEGGLGEMISFLEEVDHPCFVSPYNHPDYVNLPVHLERPGPNRLWRSGISTTCTFAARAGTIKSRFPLLLLYQSLNDFGMWLCITRYGLRPRAGIFSLRREQLQLGILRDWARSLTVFMARRLWKVPSAPMYYPLRSLATHMDANYIGLGTVWPFRTGRE